MIRRQLEITATVSDDGHLPETRRRQIADYLAVHAGRDVLIRVGRPKRSTQANAYVWGVVYPAIQRALAEAGQAVSCEALHEHFKQKYLPPRTVEVFDETLVLAGSSADLDSEEFYDFVESIRTDEAVLALGVEVPDPDPAYRSYRLTAPA